MRQLTIAAAIVLMLGGTAFAQSPTVGEDAASLGSLTFAMNPTDRTDISSMRGEVIMIERWGVNCGPCIRYMPTLQQKYEKYGSEGLHVFAIESQNHNEQQIRDRLESFGLTFPVTTNTGNGYRTGGGIPCAWLVDVNGKVVFAGNPFSMGDVLDSAMEDVLYPGLGRADIHEDLDSAARLFSRRDYAGARSEAQRILERADRHEDQAVEDAQFIVDRVNGIAENMFERAQQFEEERHYLDAIEMYEQIEELFGREEEGERAGDRVRELERDRSLRDEISAAESLRSALRRLGEDADAELERRLLEQWLDSNERRYSETRAYQDAQERLEELS